MKRTIYKLVFILAVAITSSSCEDFLSQDNPNYPETEGFFESLNSANQSLAAVYAALRNESVYNIHYEVFRADLAWPGAGRPVPHSQGMEYNCYIHNYNNTSQFIENKWDACYSGIFRANETIHGLNTLKASLSTDSDKAKWVELMAQARFLRGLFHFYLHSSFNKGEIMLVDELPLNLEDFHRPLSPANEVRDFFRADLQYAYENLPVTYANTADLGRVTSGTAATILGTSYLYEYSDTKSEDALNSAMELFNYVINDCDYELMTDGDKLFNEQYEMNNESILEIVYSTTFNPEIGDWDENNFIQHLAFYTTSYNTSHLLPAWLANAYKVEKVDPLNPINKYEQTLDDGTIDPDAIRAVSLRASEMVAIWNDVYTPYYGKSSIHKTNKHISAHEQGFGYYKKYTDCKSLSKDEQKSGMNVVVNRLSEVYLMYAECLIEKGDLNEAIRMMNVIRKRWGLVLLGEDQGDGFTYNGQLYNKESLTKQLREIDKPLECSAEGHMMRWIDLRRWGMLEDRFKTLSEAKYYGVNESTGLTCPDNTKVFMKEYGIILNESEFAAAVPSDYKEINYEYDLGYQSYLNNKDGIDYYPIPMGEIEQNPNIKLN